MCANFSRIVFACTLLCLFGCAHTYVSDAGKESPDKKYKIFIVCHGKSAHAYVDYTVKKAYIGIYDKSRSDDSMLFSKWAILKATDLSWKFTWDDPQNIRIDLFEGKVISKVETPCGFIVIRKDEITDKFIITDHSDNLKLENIVYFF